MKVALIPPRGLENYALQSRFHLALAIPDLMDHRPYCELYRRASRLGDYVVLDNGAAEGTPVDNTTLVHYANLLSASEVVLPDVMFETSLTVKAVKSFLANDQYSLGPLVKYMGVVQGNSWSKLLKCVDEYSKMAVKVLGIPRHLLTTCGRPAIRIDLANKIEQEYGSRFEIHFLGTNVAWLAEVECIGKYAPHVRSLDSSLPFNYALAGRKLERTGQLVLRPSNYFDVDHSTGINRELLRNNVQTFLNWAGANAEASPSGLSELSTS